MLVFIDDSGDPGFKFDRGSSRYFVIALLIFDDDLDAEKAAVAIKDLRRQLGFSDNVEFKFNKSRKDIREKFLQVISEFNVRIRALVIDKTLVRSEELRNNKNSFYSYAIKLALKHSEKILHAKIKIDGSGDRLFRRNFLTYLRKELNSKELRIMESVKLVDSHGNVLIQSADMIAGAIHRSYLSNRTDAEVYRHIIQKRIEDEWKFR